MQIYPTLRNGAMLGGNIKQFFRTIRGTNLTGCYLGGTQCTVSETTIFSNGTIGANLINSAFSSSNGLFCRELI